MSPTRARDQKQEKLDRVSEQKSTDKLKIDPPLVTVIQWQIVVLYIHYSNIKVTQVIVQWHRPGREPHHNRNTLNIACSAATGLDCKVSLGNFSRGIFLRT